MACHSLLLALLAAWPPAGDRTREPTEAQRITQRLCTRTVTVNWEDRALTDVAADLSAWMGVSFVVAPALTDRADEVITLRLTDAPGRTVLRFVQDFLDVRFLLDRGLVLITTPEDSVRRTAVLHLYDVRSILYVPPDFRPPEIGLRPSGHIEEEDEPGTPEGWDEAELVDVLRRGVGESSWAFEGVSISALHGRLVVRHTPSVHRQIQQILRRLEAR